MTISIALLAARGRDSARLGRGSALALILALGLTGGCSTTLTSPTASALHLASPASAGEGTTLVTGAISGGGEVFGPSLLAGDVQVRHGVTERTDVGVSAMAAGVIGDEVVVPHHAGIYALRLQVHHELAPGVLALHAGVGGGGHAGGGYIAGDLGLTVGYENPVLVPYAYGSFVASGTISTNTLNMQLRDDDTTSSDPVFRTPYSTVGAKYGTGLRIPFGPREQRLGSVFLEFTMVSLAGDDPEVFDEDFGVQRTVFLLGGGLQGRIGRGEAR